GGFDSRTLSARSGHMLTWTLLRAGGVSVAVAIMTLAAPDVAIAQGNINQATLAEPDQKTPEVSTEDVRRFLADGSAIVLDSRKRSEYVAGHIAGARNVAPPADAAPG